MSQRERNEWIERAKDRVLSNAKNTDSYVYDMLSLYDEAVNQLELEISAMFQKYAADNKLTDAEASRLLTGSEYSKWRKGIDGYIKEAAGDSRTLLELNTLSAKSRISRKEQLLANMYRNMLTLSGETEVKLADLLGDIYKTNYYRNCYDVQSIIGIAFPVAKIDGKTLQRILEHPWSGKRFSESVWENTDKLAALARREITLGFMSGASVQNMAKAIDDVMGKGRYAAERLARTESSYFSNQGAKDSYRELGIEEYTYLGGGCEICEALNGASFPLDEGEPGVNMPPMHPNCKCTITAKAVRNLFQNREGAEPLRENVKFEEWKKQYVKEGGLSSSVGNPKIGVAQHEEKKLIEHIDYNNSKMVQSKLDRYTEQIAADNETENAVCITKKGNIYHCYGTSGNVFPDFDLGDELTEAYVTHNHPISETHFSFSSNDLSLFMDYKLPQLVGVDDEYIYTISRTTETVYAERELLVHSYIGENYAAFLDEVIAGNADADKDEYDFYVRRLAAEYGFEYERKKR